METEEKGEAYQLLTTTGFTPDVADILSRSYPEERIRRQCQWLPRRNAQRNRLGLLRRAIEEDWPEPQGAPAPASSNDPADVRTSEQTPAAVFAAYAYAGWADNPDRPVSTPSASDIRTAEPFVARLLEVLPDETKIPEWGRQFGAHVRRGVRTSEHQGAPTLPKSIAAALRAHGDEFYQSFIERRRREQRQAIQAARKAHEERFAEAYQEYLQRQEKELRELYPEVYDRFVEGEARERARLAGAMPASSRFREVALRTFDQESDHLERLSAFLRGQSGESIADFWSWDTALNPERFDPHRA